MTEGENLLKLVKNKPSEEIIEALARLLYLAQKGEIVGLAYIAVKPGRDYKLGLKGTALTFPTDTRGMVSALDDLLRDADTPKSQN